MDTHEVLVAARNLLDQKGWLQPGVSIDDPAGSPRCAFSAIYSVDCERSTEHAEALLAAIGLTGLCDLYRWNDTPSRTKEEVLAAFDKAIAATAPDPLAGVVIDLKELVA